MDPGDNGIYVIEGWKIVDRVGLYDGFVEQAEYGFDEMLRQFDASMPESERLGGFLDSVEVPVSELEIGDEVWMFTHYGDWRKFPVVGFGQPEHNRISVWVKTPDGKTDVTYPDQHLSGHARPRRRLQLELQQLRPRRCRAHRAAQVATYDKARARCGPRQKGARSCTPYTQSATATTPTPSNTS